jgi:HAMP domain-containing protein
MATDRANPVYSSQIERIQGVKVVMKNLGICTILIFLSAIAGLGQAQASGSATGSNDLKGNAGPVILDSGTRLEGQLQSAVDVKKAQVGDEVILKTTKAVKQNGQTVVPKGAKLLGRVTEVTKRSKENATSRLGMVFDRIQGGDISAPITASIVSVTNAAASTRVADTADADLFGSSSSSTRASSSKSSSGGGLLGGATSTVGGVLNTTTQTVGSVTNTATNTVGGTAGTVGRTVNGITISNSAGASGSAQAGSTLSAANRDIRLEKGATFQLQLNSSVRPE